MLQEFDPDACEILARRPCQNGCPAESTRASLGKPYRLGEAFRARPHDRPASIVGRPSRLRGARSPRMLPLGELAAGHAQSRFHRRIGQRLLHKTAVGGRPGRELSDRLRRAGLR